MCIVFVYHVYNYLPSVSAMRTNIVIDDELMEEAMQASGSNTKKEVVELGLKALVRLKKQQQIRKFRGKLKWEGDLSEQRTTR